jgi:hypothetical protein
MCAVLSITEVSIRSDFHRASCARLNAPEVLVRIQCEVAQAEIIPNHVTNLLDDYMGLTLAFSALTLSAWKFI